MVRSATLSRLVMLATLASIAAGLIGAAPSLAREPGVSRQVRIDTPAGRKAAPEHRVRSVRVSDLPKAPKTSRSHSADRPMLRAPARTTTGGTKAPSPKPLAPDPSVFAGSSGQLDAEETTEWQGLSSNSVEPPDPWIAAGPDHIIQAVNTEFQISTRTGGHVQTVDMFDFFDLGLFYDPGQVTYFDPRVIYDSLHGRWIAVESSFDCFATEDSDVGSGYLDIAISQSADPTGTWEVTSFGYADVVLDYPGLGTSTDKVVFSSNVFGLVDGPGGCDGDSFLGTEIDAAAWSQLTGTGAINFDPFIDVSVGYFSWRPAVQTPATSSTVHLIAEGPAGEVVYARLTGNPAVASSAVSTPVDLTGTDELAAFDVPPVPQQPGPGTIADAVDERPTDAVWQDNHLAFVSTAPCDPAGGATEDRDCVRVSELSTATTTPTAIQDFLIGEEAADHYMGGVGYAGNGDLHVVWTRSSETAGEYPSSYTAHHLVSDGANEISDPQLLQVGGQAYPGDRWGDYVGVSQDPQVPNAVWQANQFADDTLWGTHVSQLQTGGSSYVPITPERVVDSRNNTGVTGIFSTGVPKSFQVAGVGTIPADAIAVTGNVTVTGQTAAGFVAITPTATSTPPSSTLNFPLGDTRANNFTASLNAAGKLAAVYKAAAGTKAHIIVDITGYFLAGSDDATYTTTDPVRVMDTRPIGHVGTATQFQAGVPQTLTIAGANGIPAEATAITGNLTVVGQSKAGFLSVTPEPPVGVPSSSTLNFPLSDVRANGLTAALNVDGELSITYTAVAGATTHAALDITGYYVEDPGGLLFYPLNPGRVLDSRSGAKLSGLTGSFKSSIPKTLPVGGHWGVPAGAEAVTGNLTVANQTAAGFVSITPTADANPTTSTLNFPLGDIRANGVTVPLDSNSLALVYKATTGKTTHLLLDVTGYFR